MAYYFIMAKFDFDHDEPQDDSHDNAEPADHSEVPFGETESPYELDNVLADDTPSQANAGHVPYASNTIGQQSAGVQCVTCGYDLTGVQVGAACPECGASVSRSFQSMRQPTSGLAVSSLVLGILSIPTCVCCGVPSLICGVLAIVFYYQVQNDIRSGRVSHQSSGMAMAGMIMGWIGIAFGVISLLLMVIANITP